MTAPATSHVYTLIGYKSDRSDYCRGCLMDQCGSDFELNIFRDQPKLIEHWSRRIAEDEANKKFHSDWNFTLLINGIDSYTSTGVDADDDALGILFNQIQAALEQELAKQKAAKETQRVAAEQAAATAAAEAKARAEIAREAAERAELKRLSLKFGDTK